MIISVEDRKAGKLRRCRVYDANGEQVQRCIYADTETGLVRRFREVDGNLVKNPETDDVDRIEEMRPAPLRVEWII